MNERIKTIFPSLYPAVTVVMSLITMIFPSLFDYVALLERYHPRKALMWQLARILGLYLLNLYTLILALWSKVQAIANDSPLTVGAGSEAVTDVTMFAINNDNGSLTTMAMPVTSTPTNGSTSVSRNFTDMTFR